MTERNLYGPILGRIRRDRNIKAEYVARKIGVSTMTYSKIERGRCGATYDRVVAICNQLGLSLDQLAKEMKLQQRLIEKEQRSLARRDQ